MDPVLDANCAVIRVGDRVRPMRESPAGAECIISRFEERSTYVMVWGRWSNFPEREIWIANVACVLVPEEKPPPDPNDMSMFDLNEPKGTRCRTG